MNAARPATATFVKIIKPVLLPFQSSALMTYCLQILLVFLGTTFGLKFLGYEFLIVPVTLGQLATALTDFD